jgi:hypothetical protein
MPFVEELPSAARCAGVRASAPFSGRRTRMRVRWGAGCRRPQALSPRVRIDAGGASSPCPSHGSSLAHAAVRPGRCGPLGCPEHRRWRTATTESLVSSCVKNFLWPKLGGGLSARRCFGRRDVLPVATGLSGHRQPLFEASLSGDCIPWRPDWRDSPGRSRRPATSAPFLPRAFETRRCCIRQRSPRAGDGNAVALCRRRTGRVSCGPSPVARPARAGRRSGWPRGRRPGRR